MIGGLRWFRRPDRSDSGTGGTPWGGWRRLRLFWVVVVALMAATGTTVQLLGPPDRPATAPQGAIAPQPPIAQSPVAQPPATGAAGGKTEAPAPAAAPTVTATAIGAEADQPLYERAPRAIGGYLPRIAPDGRKPMQVFAAPFDRRVQGPRVGLIVAGIGMNEADSLAAARTLRGGVTFALTPYAGNPERVVAELRRTGHETLISVPMEPVEFPLSDPGPRALLTMLSPEDNLERLHWVMSRTGGYVGMTNALGAMRGERFSGMGDQMTVVLRELARRGLMFVDARADAGRNHLSWHRSVDLVIDDIATEERIDQRLELLSRLARDRGSALGLATQPRPVTVDRIAAWTNGLADKGIILAPITAIALAPAPAEEIK